MDSGRKRLPIPESLAAHGRHTHREHSSGRTATACGKRTDLLKRRGALLGVVVAAVVVGALSGCTVDAPEPDSTVPTETPGSPGNLADKPPEQMSSVEAAQVVGQCLIDQGWDVQIGRTSTNHKGPPEQADLFQEALFESHESIFGHIESGPEYTDEFLERNHQAQIEARDCLIGEGYSPPEVPSLQRYKDNILIDGYAYSTFDEAWISSEDTSGIRDRCTDPLETWGQN